MVYNVRGLKNIHWESSTTCTCMHACIHRADESKQLPGYVGNIYLYHCF